MRKRALLAIMIVVVCCYVRAKVCCCDHAGVATCANSHMVRDKGRGIGEAQPEHYQILADLWLGLGELPSVFLVALSVNSTTVTTTAIAMPLPGEASLLQRRVKIRCRVAHVMQLLATALGRPGVAVGARNGIRPHAASSAGLFRFGQ